MTKLEKGVKYDGQKPRFDLIPPHAEEQVARVLEFGARKYDEENWRKVPEAVKRYIAAAGRHINSYRNGEKTDPETGIAHLAHAVCCLMFVIELEKDKSENLENTVKEWKRPENMMGESILPSTNRPIWVDGHIPLQPISPPVCYNNQPQTTTIKL